MNFLLKYFILCLAIAFACFLLWNRGKIFKIQTKSPTFATKMEITTKQSENYPQDFSTLKNPKIMLSAKTFDPNALLIQITQSDTIIRYIFKGKILFEIDNIDKGPNKAFEAFTLPQDNVQSPLNELEPMRSWSIDYDEAKKIMQKNAKFKNTVFATYSHLQVYSPKQPAFFALANRPLPDLKNTPFWATSAFNFKTHQEFFIYVNAITGEIAYTEEFIIKKLPE